MKSFGSGIVNGDIPMPADPAVDVSGNSRSGDIGNHHGLRPLKRGPVPIEGGGKWGVMGGKG
jgi:hypothetical protein